MVTIENEGGDLPKMLREIAGCFVGLISLLLVGGGIFIIANGGDTTVGFALIATGTTPSGALLGFFVGENNGIKKASTT